MFFSTVTHRHCTGFVLVVVGITDHGHLCGGDKEARRFVGSGSLVSRRGECEEHGSVLNYYLENVIPPPRM